MGSTTALFLVRLGSAGGFGVSGVEPMGFVPRLFFDFFATGCFSVLSEISCVSVLARLRLCRNLETSFDKAG